MDLIDATIVNVALPSIRTDLHASPAHLEWIVSAYLLAFGVLLVTGGRLGDIAGRRTIFVIGVAGFTLFSLGAAIVPNPDLLVVARVGQGAFAALMAPQLLSSIQVLYAPKERAAIFGVVGAVSGLAAVIGPVLGGWLVTADVFGLGWRSIFLLNVPIGIAIIAAALAFVPNTTSPRPPRLDLPGVVLATLGLFLVSFPIVEGREHDWAPWIWAMLAAGGLVLATFCAYQVRRERRDGSALLPMHLFRNRGYSAGLVTQAVFQGSLGGFAFMATLYLQSGLGFSAIHAGLTLLPFSVGAFVGTGISVPLGVKLGKIVMFVGALCQAAGVWWWVVTVHHAGAALTSWDLAAPFALNGIGLGLLIVPLIDIALATVPTPDAGSASGAYGTFQQVGAATGIAVVGVVFFGAVGSSFGPAALEHGVRLASWVAIIGYLIAAVSTLLLPSRAAVRAHVAERERELATLA
jgi:EmrB/QacA subfamily drug resistance transporter